jgi:hypothetical protein
MVPRDFRGTQRLQRIFFENVKLGLENAVMSRDRIPIIEIQLAAVRLA